MDAADAPEVPAEDVEAAKVADSLEQAGTETEAEAADVAQPADPEDGSAVAPEAEPAEPEDGAEATVEEAPATEAEAQPEAAEVKPEDTGLVIETTAAQEPRAALGLAGAPVRAIPHTAQPMPVTISPAIPADSPEQSEAKLQVWLSDAKAFFANLHHDFEGEAGELVRALRRHL